jgi:hypothetical protein
MMERGYTEPENAQRLFEFRKPQPFLLRPLTELEMIIVDKWISYYKARHRRGHERVPANDLEWPFIKHLRNKHFDVSGLEPFQRTSETLFQNLFVYAPGIVPFVAIRRLSSFNIRPTLDERRDAFREIVEMYRADHGENALPDKAAFKAFHADRVFLPRTGIIAPAWEVFLTQPERNGSIAMLDIYRFYCEGYDKVSPFLIDETFTHNPLSDQDFINDYHAVHVWLKEMFPYNESKWTPSLDDISVHNAEHGGLSLKSYRRWITNSQAGAPEDQRSFEWLQQQLGLEVKTRKKGYPEVRRFSTEQLRRIIEQAWERQNPEGFQPRKGILIDPVARVDFPKIKRIQMSIYDEFGTLDPSACVARGVPDEWIPSFSVVQKKYPGGYMGLLRDIENDYAPHDGITFTKIKQIKAMQFNLTSGRNVPDRAPRAIGRTLN